MIGLLNPYPVIGFVRSNKANEVEHLGWNPRLYFVGVIHVYNLEQDLCDGDARQIDVPSDVVRDRKHHEKHLDSHGQCGLRRVSILYPSYD